MELAAIITTLIVVILQIITISMVVGTRKMVRDQAGKASQAPSFEKTGDRRDRDFRSQNKRPVHDQRPRPPITPAAPATTNTGSVDTVEKSLRDINLKLKNAERDQEFARRKVQENFPKEPNRRPPNNDRNIRGGRDNGRDGSRDNRDRDGRDSRDNRDRNNYDRNNRNQRGGNWQERNKSREEMTFQPIQPTDSVPKIENQTPATQEHQFQSPELQQPVSQVQAQINVADSPSEITATDFGSDDNLQHGRKVMVKRRVLKEGDESSEGSTDTSSSDNSNTTASDDHDNSSQSDAPKAPESEIRFGRR